MKYIPPIPTSTFASSFASASSFAFSSASAFPFAFAFSLALLLSPFPLLADEGDTLIIQTIDWNTPPLPGWNSPRSGTYAFPGDTMTFSKILMYYTLKCDPNQNPACGEWDYTTHTRIQEHTGEYDSNLYYHPQLHGQQCQPGYLYVYG